MNEDQILVPFFPLSVFLLPGEDIPLQIFEPRYKQLIGEARAEGIRFVIPFVIDSEMQKYGCEVRLKQVVAENSAGRMVIIIESVAVVRITSYIPQLKDKLYAGGRINYLDPPAPVNSTRLKHFVELYNEQYDNHFQSCCKGDPITDYDVLKALNLSSEEKFNFLLMDSTEQRENYLVHQIQFLMMIRKQEQLLGDDFGLN